MENISRVSDQNDVSPLHIMHEIHHSGREPSIFSHNFRFSYPQESSFPRRILGSDQSVTPYSTTKDSNPHFSAGTENPPLMCSSKCHTLEPQKGLEPTLQCWRRKRHTNVLIKLSYLTAPERTRTHTSVLAQKTPH